MEGGKAKKKSTSKTSQLASSLIEAFEFDSTFKGKNLKALHSLTSKIIDASLESTRIEDEDRLHDYINRNIYPNMTKLHSLIGSKTPRFVEEIDRKLMKMQDLI